MGCFVTSEFLMSKKPSVENLWIGGIHLISLKGLGEGDEVVSIPQVCKKWRLNKKVTQDHTWRSFSLKSYKAMKDPGIGREICYILKLVIWLYMYYITLLLIFFDNFMHLSNIVWLLLTLLSALFQPCQPPLFFTSKSFFHILVFVFLSFDPLSLRMAICVAMSFKLSLVLGKQWRQNKPVANSCAVWVIVSWVPDPCLTDDRSSLTHGEIMV